MQDREVISGVDARQGNKKKTNYRVLTRSLLLALVAAVFVYAYFYLQSPA